MVNLPHLSGGETAPKQVSKLDDNNSFNLLIFHYLYLYFNTLHLKLNISNVFQKKRRFNLDLNIKNRWTKNLLFTAFWHGE